MTKGPESRSGASSVSRRIQAGEYAQDQTENQVPPTGPPGRKTETGQKKEGKSLGEEAAGFAKKAAVLGVGVGLGEAALSEAARLGRRFVGIGGPNGEKVKLSEVIRRRQGSGKRSSAAGSSGGGKTPPPSGGAGGQEGVSGRGGGGSSEVPPGAGSPPNGPPKPPNGGEEGEGREEEPKKDSELTVEEIQELLDDPNTDTERREKLGAEKLALVQAIERFKSGGPYRSMRMSVENCIRTNDRDHFYSEGEKLARSLDDLLLYTNGANPRWRGAFYQGIMSEIDRTAVAGMDEFKGEVDRKWLDRHHYVNTDKERLRQYSEQHHIWNILPGLPWEIVGKDVSKEPSFEELMGEKKEDRRSLSEEDILRMRLDRREPLQPVPTYFMAVFAGGANEYRKSRDDLIETLDFRNAEDRKRFIILNIYAYNYRFGGNSLPWADVIKDWLNDANIANEALKARGEGVSSGEYGEFEKELKAWMAVTASARAAEDSNGITPTYMKTILGQNAKGDPDLDGEDQRSSLILHRAPETLNKVINDPLVRRYYDRIMRDAGLVDDVDHEWKIVGDPEDRTHEKVIHIPSRVEFVINDRPSFTRKYVDNGRLVHYMRNGAVNGGLGSYIEKALLAEDESEGTNTEDKTIRMAAAKIAMDAFMDDKFTRWADGVTNKGKDRLGLQSRWDMAGDPLGMIMHPTVPVRALKHYTDPGFKPVIDLVDYAFRPDDLFQQLYKDAREHPGKYDELELAQVRPLVASLVSRSIFLHKATEAAFMATGGGSATSLPSWSPDFFNKDFNTILNDTYRVYGSMTLTDHTKTEVDPETGRRRPKKIPIGKHIVGAMMMRFLCAKAWATTVASSRPDLGQMFADISDPERRTKPNLEALQTLFGPDLKGHQGLIQRLQGGDQALVIYGNMFDAEKYYGLTYELLNSNDQTGEDRARAIEGGKAAMALIGFFGEASGAVNPKRK